MGEHVSGHPPAYVIAEAQVMMNVVTGYQWVRFQLSTETLTADWPVSILGVVPRRRIRREFPLSTLRSVRLTPAVFPSRLLVAALLVVVPISLGLPAPIALPAGVLGAIFVLLGIVAAVEIGTDDGTARIPVCALQRRSVADFLDEVRATVSGVDQ